VSAQSDCHLKKDADGIKVYTCKTENEKFKSLRAEFELKSISIQQVRDFLWDVKNYTTWQYNMVEAELLSSSGKNEMAYRSLVDAPWPVDDRELVLKVKVVADSAVTSIFIQNSTYEKPPPEDVVRVPVFDASWKIISEGNKLKVTYALRIDPGGAVPAWLANIALADGPYLSFKKLKNQMEK
jgi:hypothetical protein